ncbi:MAG: 4a-hydroxytetrahydrobiopterin dehydratase [bacterium]|nr:4a-hydroxytetrahydrobiopterin dehydratase [bacterium]
MTKTFVLKDFSESIGFVTRIAMPAAPGDD